MDLSLYSNKNVGGGEFSFLALILFDSFEVSSSRSNYGEI